MKICVICKVELHCLKNGVGADFGHGHTYAGDLYACGICSMEVLFCNSWPSKDLEYENQEYYVNVKPGGSVPIDNDKRKTVLQRLKETWKR